MAAKSETMKMTKKKKNLTWQLAELPTGGELADLVSEGVISKEEAREIMFGSADNDKETIKALEEQVDFLRELVTELSKNRSQTVIHDWTYPRTLRYYNNGGAVWANTVKTLANSGYELGESIMATSVDNSNDKLVSLSVNTVNTAVGGSNGSTIGSNPVS